MPSYSSSLILLQIVACLLLSPMVCEGWISQTPSLLHPTNSMCSTQSSFDSKPISVLSSSKGRLRIVLASSTSSTDSVSVASSDDDDDDDEYEYVEYDILREDEFAGSEWMVGTVMDDKDKIAETWVRLATDKDGKNVAIWGDNSSGNWNFDVANQFLSVSKSAIWGKNIWAGVVDDFYFCRGTVRGWNFLSAASVVGQWQAKRLGVEKDEAGVAPWFQEEEEEDEETPVLTETDAETPALTETDSTMNL